MPPLTCKQNRPSYTFQRFLHGILECSWRVDGWVEVKTADCVRDCSHHPRGGEQGYRARVRCRTHTIQYCAGKSVELTQRE